MRTAYLDCFAGISGDMFLGALLDAGVPLSVLEEAVAALNLDASLHIEKVDRSGIHATKVHVLEHGTLAEAPHEHSHAHTHAHSHDSAQAHTHPHEHAQDPAHPADHQHPTEPPHTHSHQDAQTHEHPHQSAGAPAHPHEPSHPHEHSHEPQHTHSHEHTHTHTDAEAHPHSHEHSHEHQHTHAHTHQPHVHQHSHGRSLTQIRALLAASPLAPPVKHFATEAFDLLGHAEAKIHNVPIDQIHFHEVGAVDAIVDIVAASAGIAYLEQHSPLTWHASHINVGGGMVECAHGNFPVPAPATADLLRGLPTYSAHLQKELVTPTGAAILRALNPTFRLQPPMRVSSIGYGAGTRNPQGFPNVLRLSIGEAATDTPEALPARTPLHAHTADTVVVLETALDDANPQLLAAVAEQALAAGALDVMQTPVLMKKGRAATLLTVLANPEDAPALEQLLLRETTTLGIRIHHQQRSCLDRRHETVATPYGAIRIKIGSLHSEDLNASPEFEDCRAAAHAHRVPVKQVLQAAIAAYSELQPGSHASTPAMMSAR